MFLLNNSATKKFDVFHLSSQKIKGENVVMYLNILICCIYYA